VNTLSGPAGDFNFSLGGTPAEGIVLGGMLAGMQSNSPSSSGGSVAGVSGVGIVLIAPFIDWYPNDKKGWHVGGALGFGGVGVDRGDASTLQSLSLGGRASGGYDFWVGSQWSIGVIGALQFATRGTLKDGSTDTNVQVGGAGFTVGVDFTYH
jgi:hypothetical protein